MGLKASGGDSRLEGEALPDRQEASLMIQEACRRGAYKAAAYAVSILMPGCPLIKCIRMVEVNFLAFPDLCRPARFLLMPITQQ